jgi:drug/metabolite transporter (DMT)-like permease
VTLRSALFIGIVVFAGTGGEIALTHAMKRIGETRHSTLEDELRIIGRGFKQGWMWLGIAMMAVSFFSLLLLLSWADVSFVVPATASSYVVGTLGAKLLLGERVNKSRWAGVALVSIGVALVCAG